MVACPLIIRRHLVMYVAFQGSIAVDSMVIAMA